MVYTIEKDFVRFEHPDGAAYHQIIADIDGLINDPDLTRRMNFLVDLRTLPKPLEGEDMRNLATYLERFLDRVGPKFAFIINKAVTYGMIRLLSAHLGSRNIEVRIFDKESDAVEWLNGRVL